MNLSNHFIFSLDNNIYLILDSLTHFGRKGDSLSYSVNIWGALHLLRNSPRSCEDNHELAKQKYYRMPISPTLIKIKQNEIMGDSK